MKINFQITKINKINTKTYKTNPVGFQPIYFGKNNFDEVKKIPHLHCPICGLLMLNNNEQKAFIDDVANKKGKDLKDALEKYEDESIFVKDEGMNKHKTIYRKQKQEVVNILKQMALEYPNLSISELVRLKSKKYLEELIKKQFAVINELENYINNTKITQEEKETFFNVLNEYKKQALGISETKFKRKNFIYDIQSTVKDEKIKQQIIKIAVKIPTSDNEISAFFVKYSETTRSNEEIASKLIKQTSPSTEHLVPKSKQGPNKINNFICDCEYCNSSRGNILFDEWVQDKKNIQEGLQQYLADIQKALDHGELNPKYDNYIEEIIKTISQISHGKIKLTKPTSSNDEEKKAFLEKRRMEINAINRKMGELIGKIIFLRKEIAQLKEHPQFENISEYSLIQKNIKDLEAKQTELKQKLTISQQKKEICINTLNKISALELKLNTNTSENVDEILTEIEHLNKTYQIEQLEMSENEINHINEQLNQIENQINILKDKSNTLKKLIANNSQLDTSLETIETTIKKLESITSEINSIKNSIFDKQILKERLASIEKEKKELEEENIAILQKGTVDTKDNAKYQKYCHLEQLYEAANQIGEYYNSKNEGISSQNALEVIEIAQNEIRKKVIALTQKDEIRYFMNLAKISQFQEEEAIIRTRLKEINEIEHELQRLYLEYNKISENKSLNEIKALYEKLKSEYLLHQKIINFSDLTTELKNLQDILSYNQKILGKLKIKYRALNDEEYRKLLNSIYYKS